MGHSAPRTRTTNLPRPTGKCREIALGRSRSANHSKFRANYQDSGGRRAVGGRRRGILNGGETSLGFISLSPRQDTYHTHTHTPTTRFCESPLNSIFFTRCLSVPKSSWLWADKILEPRKHCKVFFIQCLGERYPLERFATGVLFFFLISPSPPPSIIHHIVVGGGEGGGNKKGRERMGWPAFQYPIFTCL